ncbi:hypothetical protein GE061_008027 [Apolygus lucorum]|uniref:Uncharacterized protein n=1 Tax=Apolygus lucorum TaxID=248454 RepID=A0A8S9WQ21_APOLU|nr:hypothetical protein GE061_008027 [Apolygus lucorum]
MKVVFWAIFVFVFVLSVVPGQSQLPDLTNPTAIKKVGALIRVLFPDFNEKFLLTFVNLAKTVKTLASTVLKPSGSRGLEPSDLQSKVKKLRSRLLELGPYVQQLTGVKGKKSK